MKNLLRLLLLSVILTSCVTDKHRARICASCPVNSFVRDSIIVVKKDTTIYITHRVVEYRDTIICDSAGLIKDFSKTIASNGVKATVVIKRNKLTVKCETDSLQEVIKDYAKLIDHYRNSDRTKIVQIECDKPHKGKIDYLYFWGFWIAVSYLAIHFGRKYLRNKLPFIK